MGTSVAILRVQPPAILEATGYEFDAAQANHSRSNRTSCGAATQIENVQAKLIWATSGDIYDVIVDLRRTSPDFGRWQVPPCLPTTDADFWCQKDLPTVSWC